MRRSATWARLKGFRRDERGAAAVEFAFIAMPFLFLLFVLMELSMFFVVSTTLEDSVRMAARRIRTGQIQQTGGGSIAAFREDVCQRMSFLTDHCRTHLTIDVRTYPQWSSATPPNPVENGQMNENRTTFVPGGPQDIVLVRAYYRWRLVSPFMAAAFPRLNNGETVLTATSTFRNEPW